MHGIKLSSGRGVPGLPAKVADAIVLGPNRINGRFGKGCGKFCGCGRFGHGNDSQD